MIRGSERDQPERITKVFFMMIPTHGSVRPQEPKNNPRTWNKNIGLPPPYLKCGAILAFALIRLDPRLST